MIKLLECRESESQMDIICDDCGEVFLVDFSKPMRHVLEVVDNAIAFIEARTTSGQDFSCFHDWEGTETRICQS